jgi:hypothetical protein
LPIGDILTIVMNDRIEFATMRRQGSSLPTREREVVITGPPELIDLSTNGDKSLLSELVNLLNDPKRAWAAEVLLVAMTRNEQDLVNSFARISDEWWKSELGRTASARWKKWLDMNWEKLEWDPTDKVFVIRRE